jgi:hypothetical protein
MAWSGWGSMALAVQNPAQQPPPIEQWYGHRRMPMPKPPAPKEVEKVEPAPRILKGKVVIWPIDWFSSDVIFQVEVAATPDQKPAAPTAPGLFQPPAEEKPATPAPLTAQKPTEEAGAITPASAETPAHIEQVPAKPTEVAVLTTLRPNGPAALTDQNQEFFFYRMAFLQLLTTLAAFVVGPLVLVLMLRLLLRRLLSGNGHLKIELLNQPQLALVGGYQGPMMPAGSLSGPAPDLKLVPAPDEEPEAEAEEEFTGEYFDLGPTYEEEKALLEEQLKQKELALMAKIMEENLGLQQQIIALGGDPSMPPRQDKPAIGLADLSDIEELPSEAPSTEPVTEIVAVTAPAAATPTQETLNHLPEDAMGLAQGTGEVLPTDALFAAIANRTRRHPPRAA